MSLSKAGLFAPDQPIGPMLEELARAQRSLWPLIVIKGLAVGALIGFIGSR